MLFKSAALGAAALLISAPVAAQDQPAAESADSSEIVVQGAKKEIRRQLWQMLEPTEGYITSFDDTFCPIIIGFDAEYSAIIEKRIRDNVRAAGIEPMEAPCRPTAVMIFIDEPQELVNGLRKTRPGIFNSNYVAEIRAMAEQDRPYYSWKAIDQRTVDGVPLRDGVAPARATRLAANARYDIVGSYLIVDIDKTPGMSLDQIADFATLHLLVELDRDVAKIAEPLSILRLFDIDDPSLLPHSMSAQDRAMLSGIYDSDLTELSGPQQRQRLATTMARELEEGEKGSEEGEP